MFYIPEQRQQALRQYRWLLQEQAEYPYLPATAWLGRGGYRSLEAGAYQHTDSTGTVCRLTMLSQTSMLLAFRNEEYLGGSVVNNDEEFLRLLAKHAFPLPV